MTAALQELKRRNLLDMGGEIVQWPETYTLIYRGPSVADGPLIDKLEASARQRDGSKALFSVGAPVRASGWFAMPVKMGSGAGPLQIYELLSQIETLRLAGSLKPAELRYWVPLNLGSSAGPLDTVSGALAAAMEGNPLPLPGPVEQVTGTVVEIVRDVVKGTADTIGEAAGAVLKPATLPLVAVAVVVGLFMFGRRS